MANLFAKWMDLSSCEITLLFSPYSSCNIILHAFRLLWAMSINHRGALIHVRWVRTRRAMSQWRFSRDAWRFCGCTARICPTTSWASRWCRGTKLVVTRASTAAFVSGEFNDIESSSAYPNVILFWCFLSDEPMLCISDALMCDGIRQCPEGGGMFNDEDEALCKKHRFDDQDLKNVRKLEDLSLFISFLCIFRLSFFRVSTSHQFGNIWLSASSKTSSAQSSQRQRSHPWIQCRAIPTRKSVRRSPRISTTISEMSTWTSASTTTSQRWEFKSRLRRDLLRLREGARETIIYRVTALGGIWCWGCLCARLCCWCAASGSALGECRRTMCWSSLTMASRWR